MGGVCNITPDATPVKEKWTQSSSVYKYKVSTETAQGYTIKCSNLPQWNFCQTL